MSPRHPKWFHYGINLVAMGLVCHVVQTRYEWLPLQIAAWVGIVGGWILVGVYLFAHRKLGNAGKLSPVRPVPVPQVRYGTERRAWVRMDSLAFQGKMLSTLPLLLYCVFTVFEWLPIYRPFILVALVPAILGRIAYTSGNARERDLLRFGEQAAGVVEAVKWFPGFLRWRISFDFRGQREVRWTRPLFEIPYDAKKVGDEVTVFVDTRNPKHFSVVEASPFTVV